MNAPAYSIIIPVYNSTDSLKELVNRIDSVFRNEIRDSYEIIMIDDASPNEETWPVMEALASRHDNVRVIQLMRNFGKHAAVLCGFAEVKGQYIITMDDDLQHRPEDIPRLISRKSHDLVLGSFKNKQHSLFKRVASDIKGWFDHKISGKPRHIQNSPFKLIKRDVIEGVLKISSPYPFISAMLFYCTGDVVNVDVSHAPRRHGKSGFTIRKMIRSFSNLMINNSSFLLQTISVTGLAVSSVSFLLGFVVIIKKLTVGIEVPGWTSLVLLVAVQGGLILFSLGIIGEYLIRIVSSTDKKPAYIVRTRKGINTS